MFFFSNKTWLFFVLMCAGATGYGMESESAANQCPICLYALTEHEPGDTVVLGERVFTCQINSGHRFHDSCLAGLIQSDGALSVCPYCRSKLREKVRNVGPLTDIAFTINGKIQPIKHHQTAEELAEDEALARKIDGSFSPLSHAYGEAGPAAPSISPIRAAGPAEWYPQSADHFAGAADRNQPQPEEPDRQAPAPAAAAYSPLMHACLHGDEYRAFDLIEQGADVNAQDDKWTTPLMLAVRANKYELVFELIEHGADINLLNDHGQTALDLAEETENSTEVKALLLAYNAKTGAEIF